MFSGRYKAIEDDLEMLTMKLRRPYSALSVCSTSDFSPTFVVPIMMNSRACFILISEHQADHASEQEKQRERLAAKILFFENERAENEGDYDGATAHNRNDGQ